MVQIMSERKFAYEKTEQGIRILRCYASEGRVVIPRELEGIPVTELADYAFAKEMEAEPENVSDLPCICGTDLEELCLPDTMRRLGRYVFYNCIQFRRLSFYSSIAFMGAGGFTGCEHLSYLVMYQEEGISCLREILQDLKQPVTVECHQAGKEAGGPFCRLVYPEFFEEAVENTPARIISTQTHGMGIQYRNTFQNTQINFQEYDRMFEAGKYNMDLTTIIRMTIARLSCPYELEEKPKEAYGLWLREHLREAGEYVLEQGETETLRWLAETFAETREELEVLVQTANDQARPELLSILMDVLHRRFSRKRRSFYV